VLKTASFQGGIAIMPTDDNDQQTRRNRPARAARNTRKCRAERCSAGARNAGARNLCVAAAVALLAACSQMGVRSPTATAQLAPTEGNQVAGTVNFLQRGDTVQVDAKVIGLTPGRHGFHVHERGNCTAADGSSAGAHFNPAGTEHGGPQGAPHHGGDLGNLEADANGIAVYSAQIAGISLGTGEDSIIGRAVIVHASADDLKSQPAGNAGARQACGLISKSKDKWF
jgi:Cu-Zn family superoxide dismutase